MKQLVFRVCKPADYVAIAEIYNEHILTNRSTMDEAMKTAADIATWIEKFHEREGLYVLEVEDLIVGWGIIKRYSDREGYRFACETAVYLRSTELRKGYGSYIKRELIEVCRQMNYHHLVAKIFSVNTSSIAYNQKLGYEIVGRQKEVGFKNGQWMDIIIMQYIIRD